MFASPLALTLLLPFAAKSMMWPFHYSSKKMLSQPNYIQPQPIKLWAALETSPGQSSEFISEKHPSPKESLLIEKLSSAQLNLTY